MSTEDVSRPEKRMVKFSLYLYRECARAKQEGWIYRTDDKKGIHFNHMDEIPAKIREHLKLVGLAYDVADNSDETVIAPKSRKSKVVQKIRLTDAKLNLG